MAQNVITYKAIFDGKDIPTNDARKVLAVQTVVSSTNVITTNILLKFISDKKADNQYIKALAFNLSNENMQALIEALSEAQNAKLKSEKANKALVARQESKASEVKVLTGNEKIEALKALGISEDVITALLKEDAKKSTKAMSKATTKAKDVDNDIFTLATMTTTKGGGRSGRK